MLSLGALTWLKILGYHAAAAAVPPPLQPLPPTSAARSWLMNSYLVHLIAIGANFLLSKLSPRNKGHQNWVQYQGLFQTIWRIGINMFVTELTADNDNQNGLPIIILQFNLHMTCA